MVANDFSKIAELDKIRQQKESLCARESTLSAPMLTDVEMIPVIYGWFMESYPLGHYPSVTDILWRKRQFLFIIVFLYSPAVLVGGIMPRGLRGTISKVLEFKSQTSISNICPELLMWYINYRRFRTSVDKIYGLIATRIK